MDEWPPHLSEVPKLGRWIAGVVLTGMSTLLCPSACTASTGVDSGTPEYMLNVPPSHRLNPWQTMMILARKRLQDIRCMLPQASLQGSLQQPKAEVCYRKHGLRICVSSKMSFGASNYSGNFFITNRPGECPF